MSADEAIVDQISLPMRIALGAALVFAALWFVALRPKPIEAVDGPLPTVAETKAPESTKPAKAKAEAEAPAKPKPAAAKPAVKQRAPKLTGAKAVLADIEANRTVVLLFWDPKAASSDDRAVRRAVSDVDRHGGSVKVHVASLDALKGYETITKAAPVTQTPTVLVIDRKAQARAIDGLTVTREIDALVDRALKVR